MDTTNKALKEFDRSVILSDSDDDDAIPARAHKRRKSARADSDAESKDTEDANTSTVTPGNDTVVQVMAESDSDSGDDEDVEENEDDNHSQSSNSEHSGDDEDFIIDPNESNSEDDEDDEDDVDDEFDYDLFDAEVERLEFNVSSVLYSTFGVNGSTYKGFLRGAMLVHNITNSTLQHDSVPRIDDIRPFLVRLKLPFAQEVSSISLETAVESIHNIDWDKRKDVLTSIVNLIPTGGIAFKTFHYVRPMVCYLAAAHALSHAVLDDSPHKEEEDILDVVFGDLTPEEVEKKKSLRTVDGAVAQSKEVVEKWVNDLNALEDDHEFIRRIIGSISTLNAPAHVRATTRGERKVEPIYYGLCDTKIANHEGRRVKSSNKMLLRAMLICANDNTDNVKQTLGLLGKRLRVRGAGSFSNNIGSQHQILTDPNSTVAQYYHGCIASMNSTEIDMDKIDKANEDSNGGVNSAIADAFESLISPSTALGKALNAIGMYRDTVDETVDDDSSDASSMGLSPIEINRVEDSGTMFCWYAGLKIPGRTTYLYRSHSVHDAIVKALKHRSMDYSGVKTIVIANSLLTN